MTRAELVNMISERLQQVRKRYRHSRARMAKAMIASESTYYKYEKAESSPDVRKFYNMAKAFNVSLDWLIVGRGEMFYKEPILLSNPDVEDGAADGEQAPALLNPGLREDVRELLVHMEHIPMLRYEVLAMFQHFKVNNKDLVKESIPTIEQPTQPALPEKVE